MFNVSSSNTSSIFISPIKPIVRFLHCEAHAEMNYPSSIHLQNAPQHCCLFMLNINQNKIIFNLYLIVNAKIFNCCHWIVHSFTGKCMIMILYFEGMNKLQFDLKSFKYLLFVSWHELLYLLLCHPCHHRQLYHLENYQQKYFIQKYFNSFDSYEYRASRAWCL